MTPTKFTLGPLVAFALLCGGAGRASAQTAQPPVAAVVQPASAPARRPFGRVSFMVDTSRRDDDGVGRNDVEFATAFNIATPEVDAGGLEYGVNLRQSTRTGTNVQHLSLYDGFAGARLGHQGQVRLRAGHMWLPDLGTVGALAGGLVEYLQPRSTPDAARVRAGAFLGREPLVYEMGYAPEVRKTGGYVALEKGFTRRHVIGYTRVQQGALTERSVLSLTNFVPAGRALFVYQAAEFDVSGPASGAGTPGLSYFLTNARVTAAPRVELLGTYNRGRSIDARTLTDDLRNGRPVTSQSLDGLRYQSAGGRVTVEVASNVRVYAGYARDRNNRDDAATGRVTMGSHAGNLAGSGLDVSGSVARIDRPSGAYQSWYVSIGRAVGRTVYVSGDYATSLSVVRFVRSDGLLIETHPQMRRFTGNASMALGRRLSLMFTGDYERDDSSTQLRILSGLGVRW